MTKKRWLALFAVMAMILAACGSATEDTTTTTAAAGATTTTAATTDTTAPDSSAGEGGTLTLLQWQAPTALNPYLSGGTKELLASSLILEPLAEFSPEGELVPALAAEIPTPENGGVPDDLMSVTWTLKSGVLWSDGSPLTAEDVVFTYEYCTEEATGCTQSALYGGISSVEAVDDLTVKVNFEAATPFPYSAFVSYQAPIIQKAQFEACVGAASQGCTAQNFGPIGTGPYMVTEFRTNDTALYSFNPNYRGASEGKPFFGEIVLKGGGDAEASARSVLVLGEADYGWNLQVDPTVLADMEATGIGGLQTSFASNVERIEVNQTNPDAGLGDNRSEWGDGANPHPFLTNPDIVRALSLAINRQELTDIGYGAGGAPTCNVWPAQPAASTNNDWCLTQDVDAANALLDSVGAVDSNGDGVREYEGTPLRMLFQTSTNAVRQTVQDLLKSYWQQIGVEVELKNVDASVFFGGDPASPDTYQKFYADIQMYTNGSGSVDPQSYMGNWVTDQIAQRSNNYGGSNISRFASAEYDALQAELAQTADLGQRADLVIQMNDLLVQSGSIIPLIWRGSVSAFSNTLTGVGSLNAWDSEYWNIEDWARS